MIAMNRSILLVLSCMLACVSTQSYAEESKTRISPEIVPYVEFLQTQHTTPVDYIFDLFERYDVVVFGERDHRDMTQYDLIEQIISDPRFTESVGNIMTEVGANNYTDRINEVLSTVYPNDSMYHKDLIEVYRAMDPCWDKTNYLRLLNDIHRINAGQPDGKKLHLTMLSPAWSWNTEITPEQYSKMAISTSDYNYDIILGENAINRLYKIFDSDSLRKKALIILNRPHSIGHADIPSLNYTVCSMISLRFPGQVANVLLNYAFTDRSGAQEPTNNGKWDAAFRATGDRAVGFDLAGSPFGKDPYDQYEPERYANLRTYADLYHGFIFYLPYEKIVRMVGIPGWLDETFKPQVLKRFSIILPEQYEILKNTSEEALYNTFNTVRIIEPKERDIDEFEKKINRYLE